MSKFTFQFKAGDFAVTTAATGHYVARGVKVQILNQSNEQDYCVQDLSDTPYHNGRWWVKDRNLVPFVETEETGSMSKLQFKAGDFAVTIKDIEGSEVFIKKGAKVEIVHRSSSEGYLVQDLSKEVLDDGRWWVKDRNLVPFVEPASEFKYEWQAGDKIKIEGMFLGTVLAPTSEEPRSFRTPYGSVDGYNTSEDWPAELQPKGKKTKARYQAAKRAWEAEQAKPMAEPIPAEFWDLPIGSWVEFKRDEDFFNLKAGTKVQTTSALKMDGMINFQHPDLGRGFCSIRTKFLKVCEAPRPVLPVGSYATVTTHDQTGWCPRKDIHVGAKVKVIQERESDGEYFVQDLSAKVVDNGQWWIHEGQLEPLKTVWDLQEGDECYRLTDSGSIQKRSFSKFEVLLRDRGNLFVTREEAEAADAERVAAVKASR